LPGVAFAAAEAIASAGTATEKANNNAAKLATLNEAFITEFLSENWCQQN
jgi:hypothetical protein